MKQCSNTHHVEVEALPAVDEEHFVRAFLVLMNAEETALKVLGPGYEDAIRQSCPDLSLALATDYLHMQGLDIDQVQSALLRFKALAALVCGESWLGASHLQREDGRAAVSRALLRAAAGCSLHHAAQDEVVFDVEELKERADERARNGVSTLQLH